MTRPLVSNSAALIREFLELGCYSVVPESFHLALLTGDLFHALISAYRDLLHFRFQPLGCLHWYGVNVFIMRLFLSFEIYDFFFFLPSFPA